MPVVIASMNVFPNVGFEDIGYSFNENASATDIILNIISPNPIYILRGVPVVGSIPIIKDLSIQMGIYILIGTLTAIAFFKSSTLPTAVAGITALLFIPFIVDTGYMFINGTRAYHSASLMLMIMTVIIGVVALGIITLLEMASSTPDVSE